MFWRDAPDLDPQSDLICVRRDKLLNRFQGVDFAWFLIWPQSENSGKAEGVAALCAFWIPERDQM